MVKSAETGASGVYLRSARPDREVPVKDGHLSGIEGGGGLRGVGGGGGGRRVTYCKLQQLLFHLHRTKTSDN
jgi:hypothetical protein